MPIMVDEEAELAELRALIGDADLERLRPTSATATGGGSMLAQFASSSSPPARSPTVAQRQQQQQYHEQPQPRFPESSWSDDRSARKLSARPPAPPPGQFISRRAALAEYHAELADHARMLEQEKMVVTGGMSKAMFIAGDHALVMQDELPFRASPPAELVRAARGFASEEHAPVYSSFAPLTSQGLAYHNSAQQSPSKPPGSSRQPKSARHDHHHHDAHLHGAAGPSSRGAGGGGGGGDVLSELSRRAEGTWKVGEMKQALELAGIDLAGVSEKAELIALTREAVAAGPSAVSRAGVPQPHQQQQQHRVGFGGGGGGHAGKGEMQAEADVGRDTANAARGGGRGGMMGRAQTSRAAGHGERGHEGFAAPSARYKNVRSSGYGQTSRSAKPRPFVGPGWDSTPARSVPYALRGSRPVTNEPWAADEAINRNGDLEKRGTLDTPLGGGGGGSGGGGSGGGGGGGGGKLTPPASSRPGGASSPSASRLASKKQRATIHRPTWESTKTASFDAKPAWDNSKTTAWDLR